MKFSELREWVNTVQFDGDPTIYIEVTVKENTFPGDMVDVDIDKRNFHPQGLRYVKIEIEA